MKTLLLSLAFLTLSFTTNQKNIDEVWIGTFEVFMNEDEEILIYYNGNYHRCFTKYLIDQMYPECDSITKNTGLDTLFKLGPKVNVPTYKKVRM